jgi:hypothetical protein
MPKVETFLKSEEIDSVEKYADEKGLSRSAYIRAAVIYAMEHQNFSTWLDIYIDLFK